MRRPIRPSIAAVVFGFAAFAAPALAQSTQNNQSQAQAAPAVPRVYDATREAVVRGSITQTTSKPAAGLPMGLHLTVATAQGSVDVHMGPYFSSIAGEKGLIPGAVVRVTGVTMHLAAGDVFLARTVVVNGQTLTVRNENGFPVRQGAPPTRTVLHPAPAGGL